ncbi:unnamed protein product, partial [Closterium sp. NIES-53]
ARYSSPAIAALGRLLLPYLFPELSTFATVADLVTHLRTSDARYRTTVPAEFLATNQPPMFITLYFIVTRLPDSLRSVRDHFLSLDPTSLTVDLLEQHLLAAETSAVAVGAARGTLRSAFFEGCSPSPLSPSFASAAAAADVSVTEDVGAASTSAKRRSSKGKGGRGGGGGSSGGGGGSGSGVGVAVEMVEAVEVVAAVGLVAAMGALVAAVEAAEGVAAVEAVGMVVVGLDLGVEALVVVSDSSSSVGARPSRPSSSTCGKFHTEHHCSSRLDNAWRAEFGDDVERPPWAELLRPGVAIFDLDYDAIISAMYTLSFSAEGDCYRCVPPDPGIAPAALGASASCTPPGTALAEALLTLLLESGASRCFFRDSTTLTPLPAPVPIRLADPSGGLVVARSSTVLPCPAVPSGSLSGLHLPSFSTNLVSTAALRDGMVTTTTPGDSSVTPPPGSPLPATPSWHALPVSCLWSTQVSASPHALACLALHSLRRGAAALRSSLLLVSPDDCSPADSPHGRLRERFGTDLPVLRLHSDRGGEFSSNLLQDFCHGEGILQSFTLPESPQQNGVARTSMIHAAAPHFLWPFAVRYAAHQLNLWPCVSLPETSPTLRWTGKVGDASVFRVWGSRAFVHDTSADKLSARVIPCDITFDESVHFYRLFLYRSAPPPPSPLFLAPGPPSVDPLPPQGPAPSGVSQVDPLPSTAPVQVAVGSGAAQGAASGGATSGGVEPGGAGSEGARSGGTEPESVEPGGAESEGAESGGAAVKLLSTIVCLGCSGVVLRGMFLTRQNMTGFTRASRPPSTDACRSARCRSAYQGRAVGFDVWVDDLQLFLQCDSRDGVSLFDHTSGVSTAPAATADSTVRSQWTIRDAVARLALHATPPLPLLPSAASCYCTFSLTLPSLPSSSLPNGPDPESDSLRAASPTVTRFLATAVTDPLFESTAASALVTELVDFAAACRLDYATSLVAESTSASVCPPSVGGECALCMDVLEDRQEEFECFAASVPHLVSMLLAPEGDPNALDIPTPRSYADTKEGPYSSHWQAAMDAKMASWKSTGTYVDEVPPPGANIVSGMWIFRVKRPPGSPPAFKARYVARGFSQRQGVDFFQTFSPTPKMTTLRVLLHVAAQRDYELHSLDFSTAFLQGSLHEEIWLHRPPGFIGSFPARTQWSLRRPVHGLRQAPREWHDTLRTTLASLGFAPSTADPSLFLRTDTTLPPFYVLVYVDDLVFATADTEALTHVKSELQKRHTCIDLGELTSYLGLRITRDRAQRTITLTQSHMVQQVLQRFGFTYSSPQSTPLPTRHSLSAPPSDESVEPSGPYLELVGCLITSGMGLVLGGRARVVLTGHLDASWVDDLATQRSSQGYTFSLGSGSVSWRSTRSSSVLSSSCEAEIYAGAMAAQELRWLTYLLTDLGEAPRSPPVLYVDNKAMRALCQEHRLEHRTKHIALHYFLARELQQRGQLRLAYVASQANTADVFTKALQPCDHQRAAATARAGGTGGAAATGLGGARTSGAGAAGTGGVGCAGAGVGGLGAGGAGAAGAGVGGTGAGGAGAARARAVDLGAGGAGGTVRPRPYFVPLLQQVLGVPSSTDLSPPLQCPPPDQSQLPLQPASPLPAPSPYIEQSGGLTERREPASRPVLPVRIACRVPHSHPPPVPGKHAMALCPSSVPLRVPLPAPPESSIPEVPDPEYDRARAVSPTVARLLATAFTNPPFESAVASALVAELLDFAAACRLDYATSLVAESASTSPPSVGGECALGTDVLKDRQEDFECLAAAVPCFASMLLAPEGDPDAPDIPTPRSYVEAITGTYVDEVPPPGANIVDGMWIFRGVDYFQTFSPTPRMTTLWVLLHVAAQCDYELHSLDFSTAFLQGSLHEEIWLRRQPGSTGTFPAGTQWSLRQPVYGLCQAPREWHDTLRTTLVALKFAPSTAEPSLFLCTDTSLPLFYVLVYVDDLVFATADTEALTLVNHSLSAPPSDESIEPSGPYPELMGCLMYLMTCTRPDLAYPISLLARYVAPARHRKVHWDAAKRVLRYLCTTSGMGLVLGGRGPFVLTGHAGASWVDDSATQRSSSCEAEIYAGAMAAQELCWLTYRLTDLGEQPHSPPQRGQLRLAYVATRANTTDVFTKALPRVIISVLLLC